MVEFILLIFLYKDREIKSSLYSYLHICMNYRQLRRHVWFSLSPKRNINAEHCLQRWTFSLNHLSICMNRVELKFCVSAARILKDSKFALQQGSCICQNFLHKFKFNNGDPGPRDLRSLQFKSFKGTFWSFWILLNFELGAYVAVWETLCPGQQRSLNVWPTLKKKTNFYKIYHTLSGLCH